MARNGSGRKARKSKTGKPPAPGKPRRVKSLLKFLRAYGLGEEARSLREAFASSLGTTLPYLIAISYGYRTSGPKLATRIERRSHGLVPVEDLRPDIDWAYLATRRPTPATNVAR